MRHTLLALAHASSTELAMRVAWWLGYRTSLDTPIRRQRVEAFAFASPRVLGVDEFAIRRGATYGILLVNLERRQPVASSRSAPPSPSCSGCRLIPSVMILVRGRPDAYAMAGRVANPEIVQVADRFHLARHVSEALKPLLHSQRWPWPPAATDPPLNPSATAGPPPVSAGVHMKIQETTPRKRSAGDAMHQLYGSGQLLRLIAQTVGFDCKTLLRYLAQTQPPVYAPRRARPI